VTAIQTNEMNRESWRKEHVTFTKIGQRMDQGLEAPFGLLSECHRRIEGFLSALLTVADSRRGGTLAEADREILTAGLHYFRTVTPRHWADEEQSLFPRLRSSEDPHAKAAIRMVERLDADHRVAEDHHDAVEALGCRWLREGTLPAGDARALREHLVALERLYRRHIAVEDQDLFPIARRLLTPAELGAISHEMAARRNDTIDGAAASAWEIARIALPE
jgi:hemerythrin-like domain-containing protein